MPPKEPRGPHTESFIGKGTLPRRTTLGSEPTGVSRSEQRKSEPEHRIEKHISPRDLIPFAEQLTTQVHNLRLEANRLIDYYKQSSGEMREHFRIQIIDKVSHMVGLNQGRVGNINLQIRKLNEDLEEHKKLLKMVKGNKKAIEHTRRLITEKISEIDLLRKVIVALNEESIKLSKIITTRIIPDEYI